MNIGDWWDKVTLNDEYWLKLINLLDIRRFLPYCDGLNQLYAYLITYQNNIISINN